MKAALLEYLSAQRVLGLAAGLVGLASVLIGVYCLVAQRQLKGFGTAMLVIGALECGFLISYARSQAPAQRPAMIELDEAPAAVMARQAEAIERNLAAVFWVKLVYALVILGGVVSLSRLDPGPTLQGVVIAVVLHASCAITVDNFIERNGRATLKLIRAAEARSSAGS